MSHDDGESSGEVFAAYVVEQVEAEEMRRASLEGRGLAVITSSGTISGLLLAFAAIASDREGLNLSDAVTPWLIAALIAFVVAALLGVGLNSPSRARAVDPSALLTTAKERWALPPDGARKTLTSTRIHDLERVQRSNDVKSFLLLAATLAQAAAVCFLGGAAITLLS